MVILGQRKTMLQQARLCEALKKKTSRGQTSAP